MAPGHHHHGAGADLLQVDADAVPALRSAFADALTKVDRQLELAGAELRVPAWAADPVSDEATKRFNSNSLDGQLSAIETLRAYRVELDAAVDALDAVANQYASLEEDNSAEVSAQPDPGTAG